jgi:hypothetical protein
MPRFMVFLSSAFLLAVGSMAKENHSKKERELLDNSNTGKTFSACLFDVKTDAASTMSYSRNLASGVTGGGLFTMTAEVFDCAKTDVSSVTIQRANMEETHLKCLHLWPLRSLLLIFFMLM